MDVLPFPPCITKEDKKRLKTSTVRELYRRELEPRLTYRIKMANANGKSAQTRCTPKTLKCPHKDWLGVVYAV